MKHTIQGEQLTTLILTVFKLNGILISSGDQLMKDLGLTSARWKVLGALEMSDCPLTVSEVARRMGFSRQTIQRLVNDLAKEDLLNFQENAKHKRAKLLCLTARGKAAVEQAWQKQVPWVNRLADDLSTKNINESLELLENLVYKLRK